jgi:uncharacterized protein (TIRG00374 family)
MKWFRGVVFFVFGVLLFWYVYQDLDLHTLRSTLENLDYGWIFLSFLLGLSSHFLRALRWKMLIDPMGYKPRKVNLFLSVLVLYFINQVVPRGGEVARCGTVSRFEKIPFVKLVGTVFIERITDVIVFFVIFLGIFLWQFNLFNQVLSSVKYDFEGLQSKIIAIGGAALFLAALYWLFKRLGLLDRFARKIRSIKRDIKEGVRSILLLENRGLYIVYTILIFFLWLLMLYVIFFAYSPTQNLSFTAAIFAYTIGTFAYLLPIQAGIGVWHFLIIQSLFLFGLDKESGMMFALIAHAFTNLIYLVFGTIGFILLPIINQQKKRSLANVVEVQ